MTFRALHPAENLGRREHGTTWAAWHNSPPSGTGGPVHIPPGYPQHPPGYPQHPPGTLSIPPGSRRPPPAVPAEPRSAPRSGRAPGIPELSMVAPLLPRAAPAPASPVARAGDGASARRSRSSSSSSSSSPACGAESPGAAPLIPGPCPAAGGCGSAPASSRSEPPSRLSPRLPRRLSEESGPCGAPVLSRRVQERRRRPCGSGMPPPPIAHEVLYE